MWLEYIKERMPNKSVLEIGEGAGFTIYYPFEAENSMYIEDVYIDKKFRRSNLATTMMLEIEEKAKEAGFKYILGSCDPTTVGATMSAQGMLNRGFKLYSVKDGVIFFRREIE